MQTNANIERPRKVRKEQKVVRTHTTKRATLRQHRFKVEVRRG